MNSYYTTGSATTLNLGFIQSSHPLGKYAVIAAGSVVCLVSALVMAGWYVHQEILVQINPEWVPMQFNTALSFFLTGFALILIGTGQIRTASYPALIAMGFGVLTLVQYIFNVNMGLDTFFVEPFTTTNSSNPGRMAPNSALCFTLLGAAIVSIRFTGSVWASSGIASLFSTSVLALSLVAFTGYVANIQSAYGWSNFTDMAVHTAACFAVLSSTMMGFFLFQHRYKLFRQNWYLESLALGTGVLISILLSQAMEVEQNTQLSQFSSNKNEAVLAQLSTFFDSEFNALERIVSRWEAANGTPQELWKEDVSQYLRDNPAYEAMYWVNPQGKTQWSYPVESASYLDPEQVLRDIRNDTALSTRWFIGGFPTPSQRTFDVYIPIHTHSGRFDGYQVTRIDFPKFLKLSLRQSLENDLLYILNSDDTVIYQNHSLPFSGMEFTQPQWKQGSFQYGPIHWTYWTSISPQVIARTKTKLPAIIFGAGLLFSMMISGLIYLSKRIHYQSQRVAEQALEHNLILQAAGEGIYGVDTEGYTTFANPAALKMLGRSAEEMVGLLQHDVIHYSYPDGSHYPVEQCPIYAAIHRQETMQIQDEVFWRKDGSSFPVEYTSTPIINNGESLGAVVTFKDISDRKALEARLVESKNEAIQASEAKSVFLATMSHEIRTPLNGILGMTEITLASNLSPEQKRNLEMIHSSGWALLTIINDVLDFSKIEANKLTIDQVSFNLSQVVSDTLKPFGVTLNLKPVELISRMDPEIPPRLIGDPSRIRQIVINLVGNALKFTQSGHVYLNLTVKNITSNRCIVVFSIEDTGIGIAGEQIRHIFDPFVQGDNTTARKYGGTGLGLSISKKLIERMEGSIQVESQLGKGTKFTIEIPFTIAEDYPETSLDTRETLLLSGLTCLVVEDNPTTLTVLTEYFERWQVETVSMSNGVDALNYLQSTSHFPDFLLLDINLPGLDGFELVEQIRGHYNSEIREIPVIMITAYSKVEDLSRCDVLGIMGYLNKPVSEVELYDNLVSTIRYSAQNDPQSFESLAEKFVNSTKLLSILVAEDNMVNQQVVLHILQEAGHRVTLVSDGQQAIEQFSKGQFDLILMDIQMPTMDGLEATQRIRTIEQQEGRPHCRIIALTANVLKEDQDKYLANGMDGCLSKPFKRNELLELIQQCIKIDAQSAMS